jgi:hypothetical protein
MRCHTDAEALSAAVELNIPTKPYAFSPFFFHRSRLLPDKLADRIGEYSIV